MKCNRVWQAAARDEGRLSDADVASFERHADTCAECRREAALAQEIARAAPTPLSPLEHRRARARLLEQANAELTTSKRPHAMLGVAAIAIAAAAALIVRRPPPPPVAIGVDVPSPIESHAPALVLEPPAAASSVVLATPPPPHRKVAPAAPSAGEMFDDAFAAFERGAYGVADVKFERFIHAFPKDPRAEDAAYLRAVARSRLGDREGAGELARAYLEAYPHGLRRLEAQRLVP